MFSKNYARQYPSQDRYNLTQVPKRLNTEESRRRSAQEIIVGLSLRKYMEAFVAIVAPRRILRIANYVGKTSAELALVVLIRIFVKLVVDDKVFGPYPVRMDV